MTNARLGFLHLDNYRKNDKIRTSYLSIVWIEIQQQLSTIMLLSREYQESLTAGELSCSMSKYHPYNGL